MLQWNTHIFSNRPYANFCHKGASRTQRNIRFASDSNFRIDCFLGIKYYRATCFISLWTNCRWQHRPVRNILTNLPILWNRETPHKLVTVPLNEQIPPNLAFKSSLRTETWGVRSEIQRSNKVGKIASLPFILKNRMLWKADQVCSQEAATGPYLEPDESRLQRRNKYRILYPI